MLLGLQGPQESKREAHLTHPMLSLAGYRTNPVSVSWCVLHLCCVTFLRVTVEVLSGEAVGRPLVLEQTLVWGDFGRGSLGPACSGHDGTTPLLRLGSSAASGHHRAALGCNKPGSAGLWLQSHDSPSAPLIHVESAYDIPGPECCQASDVLTSVKVSFSSSPFPLPFTVLPSLSALLPYWDVFLQEPARLSGAGLRAEQEQPGASSALRSWACLDGEVGTFGNAGGAARGREHKVCKCPAWYSWFPAGLLQCLSEDI